ncbi:kinesin-like protein subito isoform X2 [Diabrotica undecimpunctata]|uniref:kinesin-like protein subito isoform X2 n=1 Tax=Diabrotica undecimpunctata TaxID=50387 RepID=UPI003B637160
MEQELVKSYLQARDPSIMAYNRTDIKEVKVNLGALMESNDTEVEDPTESEEDKCINVYLRIRGDIKENDLYEIDENSLICNVPEGCFTFRNVKSGDSMKRNYSFTKIFGPEYDQQTIFNYIIKSKLLSFINGRSSTIFTYGASGSGKTFTIVGTPEEPGLIPRALEYLFRSIPKVSQNPDVQLLPNGSTQYFSKSVMEMHEQYKNSIMNATIFDDIRTYKRMQERLSSEPVAKVEDDSYVSVSVWVSFAEIYNEIIYDLLSLPAARNQPRQRLALGKSQGNTFIKKLTYLNVRNGLEAYQILQYGLHNLNYAATAINSHSSRSHCIFTVTLVQTSKCSDDVYVSNFNFCDLAGSERLKKTMNFGDRLKESNNINTSLLVLGRCMENIRKCQQIKDSRLIPFRESKLTQIFQTALLGHENVEMIVNINPSRNMFDETVHVLNFSAIAKSVIVKEELPKPIKKETRFSILMKAENSPRFKDVVTNKLEVEKLTKKYNRAKEEIRRLQTLVNRLNEELSEGLTSDEKSEEIKHLHRAIDKIIDERDSVIQIYEKKMVENADRISAVYEESIARYIEMHKKDKQESIQRIRKEYEERIAEMQVITISSSDEEDDSPKKPNGKSQKELEDRIVHYQNLVGEMSDELRGLREELKDKEDLLEDAKEHFTLLELDIESYRKKYNKEKSEAVLLREQIELLTLELQKRSICVASEESSDTDDNEIQSHEQETNSFIIAPKIEPNFSLDESKCLNVTSGGDKTGNGGRKWGLNNHWVWRRGKQINCNVCERLLGFWLES